MQFEIHITNVEIDWACDLKNRFGVNSEVTKDTLGVDRVACEPTQLDFQNFTDVWTLTFQKLQIILPI